MTRLEATAEMCEELEARIDAEKQALRDAAAERIEMIARKKAEEAERMRQARGVPKRRSKQVPPHLGQPVWERRVKAHEGFEDENLAPQEAPEVIRSRERSPITHHDAEKRNNILDKALRGAEVHALFRFVVGTMVAEGRMRLKVEDTGERVPIKPDYQNRLPFNNAERLEIGARQFVYGRLPEESQRDIDILTDQVMPRSNPKERQFDISPVEFGKLVTGSTDERVARGGYIGTFKKLAHHVNHLYVEWELIQFRRIQEAKAARNLLNSPDADLSTGLMEKVLAK